MAVFLRDKIFISYAHKDLDLCHDVCDFLREQYIDFWQDEKGLPPAAENFNEEIENAIRTCKYFVFVWTENSKQSEYCKKELSWALDLKEKNKDEKHIFVLKCEEHLDATKDLPPGCGIRMTGTNYLNASYREELNRAIQRIKEYIYDQHEDEYIEIWEVREQLTKYSEKAFKQCSCLSGREFNITGNDGNLVSDADIIEVLTAGRIVSLCGERGSGKSEIFLKIYNRMLSNMMDSIEADSETVIIPILLKTEDVWGLHCELVNEIPQFLCKRFQVPYTNDKRAKYVILLDGNQDSSMGSLPRIIETIIRSGAGKNGICGLMIGSTHRLMLRDNHVSFMLGALTFPGVVKFIVSALNNNQIEISRFFNRLFKKAFEESNYNVSNKDERFTVVRRIYSVFKNDEILEKGGSLRVRERDFYSKSLASTTQKGRLPNKLDENMVSVWKKLILGNEIFHAIRNPYYLNWLLKLYVEDKDFVFPYRTKTLQVAICQKVLEGVGINEEEIEEVITVYLYPLAKQMYANKGANCCISYSDYRNIVRATNLERIVKLLVNCEILSQFADDITFRQDFFFDYFLNYSSKTSTFELESDLRVCATSELPDVFFEYISSDKSVGDVDTIEVAADIIMWERDNFPLTSSERIKLLSIAQQRLVESRSAYRRNSILSGIGKLLSDNSLIYPNEDAILFLNSGAWVKLDNATYLMKYPVTNYDFEKFVSDGYQNKEFWEYGTDFLTLKSGLIRKRPLSVDDGMERKFTVSNHPVVGINWYEAMAFCKWLSTKMNVSCDVILPSVENIERLISTCCIDQETSDCVQNFTSTFAVSALPMEEGKVSDLLGNIWEWSTDTKLFHGDVLTTCYGGCWGRKVDTENIKTTYPAKLSSNNIGFRAMLKIH